MKIMATSFKSPATSFYPQLPPTLQQATADPSLCWILLDILVGKSASISCGVIAPFFPSSLAHKVCGPLKDSLPCPAQFWQLCDGVNGDLRRGVCHAVCTPTAPAAGCRPLLRGHSVLGSVSVSCEVPGSWITHTVCFSPLGILWRSGPVWFNQLAPSYLLGLLLCTWTWGCYLLQSHSSTINHPPKPVAGIYLKYEGESTGQRCLYSLRNDGDLWHSDCCTTPDLEASDSTPWLMDSTPPQGPWTVHTPLMWFSIRTTTCQKQDETIQGRLFPLTQCCWL